MARGIQNYKYFYGLGLENKYTTVNSSAGESGPYGKAHKNTDKSS